MRPYDDLVEVRKAPAGGCGKPGLGSDLGPDLGTDLGPDQFLWRGRLWQVREVIAHWVESGAWWVARPEEAPHGSQLAREREVWRVAAARGRAVSAVEDPGFGVFDLAFDWTEGVWRLAGSLD